MIHIKSYDQLNEAEKNKVVAYHTSPRPLKKMGDSPMWFTENPKFAKAYHDNAKENGGKAFTYEVEIRGNIMNKAETRKILGQDVMDDLTANPTAKEVVKLVGPLMDKADGMIMSDYNPIDTDKTTKSILMFEPAKSVRIKERIF